MEQYRNENDAAASRNRSIGSDHQLKGNVIPQPLQKRPFKTAFVGCNDSYSSSSSSPKRQRIIIGGNSDKTSGCNPSGVNEEESVSPPTKIVFPSSISIEQWQQKKKNTADDDDQVLYFDSQKLVHSQLSSKESDLWSSLLGAKFAACRHSPGITCRRLGTITRNFTSSVPTIEELFSKKYMPKTSKRSHAFSKKKVPSAKTPSLTQIKAAMSNQTKSELSPEQVETAAVSLQQDWKQVLKSGPMTKPAWDQSGQLISAHWMDRNYLTLDQITQLMKSNILIDSASNSRSCCLYGLRKIAVDTISVLKALKSLALPCKELYGVPFVVAYSVLRPVVNTSSLVSNQSGGDGGHEYQLSIGVYANRLLFEIMTHDLVKVLSALDPGSYDVSCPLTVPAQPKEPTFASDPNVEVVVVEEDGDFDHQSGTSDQDLALLQASKGNQAKISAFTNAGFLKMIENHGTDISDWSSLKQKLEGRVKVQLLLHQIHGLCWMYRQERLPGMGLNSMLWEERRFQEGDCYYYSPALGQARLRLGGCKGRQAAAAGDRVVKGGILADEMGLGKTVQVLALIVATLDELRQEAASKAGDKHKYATLIVVPPALVSQWLSEIKKITGDDLVYDFFDHKQSKFIRHSTNVEGPADIVLTTYSALDRTGKKGSQSPIRHLISTTWGRVVLDEMQEIRSSTTVIAQNCERLDCNRRWMLSGTPLFEGIEDFRGELCFLQLEPFAASNDDGFFRFFISNNWENRSTHALDLLRVLSLVMLRRSKNMSVCATKLPLMGLKPLTITFEPIPQDNSERALYCFLEFLMHTILKCGDEKAVSVKNKTSFLRLLRELCVSPVLLNGGFGCKSQLGTLNRWMQDLNRLQHANYEQKEQPDNYNKDFSCDEAIRFLSQVIDIARVDSDFVTDQTMAGSAGVSRRDRAMEPTDVLYERAKETQARAANQCKTASTKRSRAHWHILLEGVTTGKLPCENYRATTKTFRTLWLWRSISLVLCGNHEQKNMPTKLLRGWRPSKSFLGTDSGDKTSICKSLFRKYPSLYWAHPFALLFSNIPKQVTLQELEQGLATCLENDRLNNGEDRKCRAISLGQQNDTWQAVIHFETRLAFDYIFGKLKSIQGISITCLEKIPWVEQEIALTKQKLVAAAAENKVHPCHVNSQKLTKTRKDHKEACLGLRILARERHRGDRQGTAVRLMISVRSDVEKASASLYASMNKRIEEATGVLTVNQVIREQEERKIQKLKTKMSMGPDAERLENLNTFEALQALKAGQACRTVCPICYSALGHGEGSDGKVYLTRCGHLSCAECFEDWIHQKELENSTPSCIECRKEITRTQLVRVDPEKKTDEEEKNKRRKQAKNLVQQAADMLDQNNGQLDPSLWEAIYLSIDPPVGAECSAHGTFTAIPSDVLSHLCHATGLRNHGCTKFPTDDSLKLSSKMRALLTDLPRNELSVVFTSSKAVARHVMEVLIMKKIGCRGLFAGESEHDTGIAVSDWLNDPSVIVLVVQSGLAACGLTLTAASKMFFMEPLLKHEEEQQAYARLHRYGQTKSVSCCIYYTPVSVESRLLEWRKRIRNSNSSEGETTIYAPLRNEESEKNIEELEQSQTRYLLGLNANEEESLCPGEDASHPTLGAEVSQNPIDLISSSDESERNQQPGNFRSRGSIIEISSDDDDNKSAAQTVLDLTDTAGAFDITDSTAAIRE